MKLGVRIFTKVFMALILLGVPASAWGLGLFADLGYMMPLTGTRDNMHFYYSDYSNQTQENVFIPKTPNHGFTRFGFTFQNFGLRYTNFAPIGGSVDGPIENFISFPTGHTAGNYSYRDYALEGFYEIPYSEFRLRIGGGVSFHRVHYSYVHVMDGDVHRYGRVSATGNAMAYNAFVEGRWPLWKYFVFGAEGGMVSGKISKFAYDHNVDLDLQEGALMTNPDFRAGETVTDTWGKTVQRNLTRYYLSTTFGFTFE